MKLFTTLLRTLFPPHTWVEETVDGVDHRTCTTCDRKEEFFDDGLGGFWDKLHDGDPTKH